MPPHSASNPIPPSHSSDMPALSQVHSSYYDYATATPNDDAFVSLSIPVETIVSAPSAAVPRVLEATSNASAASDSDGTCDTTLPLANLIILALNLVAICTLMALAFLELRRRHRRDRRSQLQLDAYSSQYSEPSYKYRHSDACSLSPVAESRLSMLKVDRGYNTPGPSTPCSPTGEMSRFSPSPLALQLPSESPRVSFLPEMKPPRHFASLSSMRTAVTGQIAHKLSSSSLRSPV